jgi:YHYH protein
MDAKFLLLLFFVAFLGCNTDDSTTLDDNSNTKDNTLEADCSSDQTLDTSRGDCNETLPFTSQYNESINGTTRTISTNTIPNHMVGLFGNVPGAINPNAISEQSETYSVTTIPELASSMTPLILTSGTFPNAGPQYEFGVLLNGVVLDPVAAEPFPHEGAMSTSANWEWNLEATNVRIGLDCNNAHVQPTGKYHYHGSPTLYLEDLNVPDDKMTLVGYSADGFPIYHKYAYEIASDGNSSIIEMTSSYQLKSGNRPGDGVFAPCDVYNGVYSNDYEYIEGLATLDEANGRAGITPEYPDGTYYYVLTDDFPNIPRYFRGTPSQDFKLGM